MTSLELETHIRVVKEYVDRQSQYYQNDEVMEAYSRALITYFKLKEEWTKAVHKEDAE